MEKLTKRDKYGAAYAKGDNIDLSVATMYTPSIVRGGVVDRLAAYEDTGLDPEEIKACMDGLEEYRKAEAEDRLVVLPCKPGDTIYQFRKKSHALGPGVHERHVACITVWGPDEWSVEHGGKTPCRSQDIGKTWFLTREEAEAALKERRTTIIPASEETED